MKGDVRKVTGDGWLHVHPIDRNDVVQAPCGTLEIELGRFEEPGNSRREAGAYCILFSDGMFRAEGEKNAIILEKRLKSGRPTIE